MSELQTGTELRSDYHEMLANEIKMYYAPLRVFGTICFAMTSIGMLGFLKSFFVDDAYSEGLFGVLPIFKWVAFFFSILFIGGLMFGTYKMMMIAQKEARAVENGDFFWKYGRLTNKERYNNKATIWIDDEKCNCLGMSVKDYYNARLGDEYLFICFGENNPIKFGMRLR